MSGEFFQKIISLEPSRASGNSEYGSRVMPVLELYNGLTSYEEQRAFRDALEQMLRDDRENVRRFAVDICIGFFTFRHVI